MCKVEQDIIALIQKMRNNVYMKPKLAYSVEGKKRLDKLRDYEEMFYDIAYTENTQPKVASEEEVEQTLVELAQQEFEDGD